MAFARLLGFDSRLLGKPLVGRDDAEIPGAAEDVFGRVPFPARARQRRLLRTAVDEAVRTEAATHRQNLARGADRTVERRPLRPQAGVDAVVELVRLKDAARPLAGIVRGLPAFVHVSVARHDIAAVRG